MGTTAQLRSIMFRRPPNSTSKLITGVTNRLRLLSIRGLALYAGGGASDKKNQLYLHIAPCGDFWSGDEVFAAKHLQPDYVKSIPWNLAVKPEDYLEDYEGDVDALLRNAYDSGHISFLDKDTGERDR